MPDSRKIFRERSGEGVPGATGDESRPGSVATYADVRPTFEIYLAELSSALSIVPVHEIENEVPRWLEQFAQELGAERCSIGEFYSADDKPRFLVHWQLGDRPEAFLPDGKAWLQRQLSACKVVCVTQLDDMPAEAGELNRYLKAQGVRSGLWVPMVVQGSSVGAIGLSTLTYERNWPDRVVERCQLVGHIVGSALLRRHEIREIEGRSQFETLITEFSSLLMNTPGNTDRVTDDILKMLGEFLHVERAGYLEIDASRNCVVPTRHWASEGVSNSAHLRYTDVSATFPWLTGRIVGNSPVVISDLDQFPSEAAEERRYCETLGIKSFTMVPALLRGKVVAALSLDSFNEHRAWDDKILQRLRIVADMIAGAQARDKAQRELEELHHFEQAISRISTDFVNLAPDEVDGKITAALKLIATTLDVDLITLLQPRQLNGYEVTHEWSSKAVPEDEFSGIRVEKIFPWLADRLVEGEAIVISSLADFPSEASAERAAMIQAGLESVLWVPFEIRGKVAGHLAINTIRQRTWHDELIPRLRLLGEVFGETMQRRDSELALQKSFREIETLKEQLQQENLYLRQEAKLSQNFGDIIGDSATLRAALQKVEQVAATDSTVLILGETGTGKELLARAIHSLSNRKDKIMIKVNCAALPSSLVEAELFGREKGAYTGALSRELGRFEIADESTILLDEIAELPLELQSKLLRVLEDGEFERLGSSTTKKVNVRVLAATNRDLAQAVVDKEFREDLYYRLNVFPIEVPPLRKHAEDIPPLVWAFVQEFSEAMGKIIETIPRATMDALKTYPWPGNVRELRNVIERAMIVSPGPRLDVELPILAVSGSDTASSDRLADIERDHIQSVLNSTAWRIRGEGGAAERLGLKPTTLEARMKKLELERPDSR